MTSSGANAPETTHQPNDLSSISANLHKHPRFLSDWEDSIIEIDTRGDGDSKSSKVVYDLSKITLIPTGKLSFYSDEPIPLTNLPDYANALKIALNAALRDRNTEIGDHLNLVANHSIRFFAFCIGHGVYNLSNVSRDLLTKYKNRVLRFGWWSAGNYNFHLRNFLRKLKTSEFLQKRLRRPVSNNIKFSLNIEEIQALTGLRIPRQRLPRWFYDAYRKVTGERRLPLRSTTARTEPSEQSAVAVFESINYLPFLHPGSDAIPFTAYPNPTKICQEYFKELHRDKRTATLGLPIAVAIISESLRWLYEYGPSMLEILNEIREALEAAENKLTNVKRRQELCLKILGNGLRKFQARHHLPLPELEGSGRYPQKWRILLLIHHTAMFFNIAGTTARRRNEISGEERIYGLYFGCVRKVQEDSDDRKVDFYIEKTLQDYHEFWAPKICVDAIYSLEAASQVFRSLGSESKVPNENLDRARQDKLFVLQNFTAYAPHIIEPSPFFIDKHSSHFFMLCGVDRSLIFNGNKSIFRRFYCNLFVNRYDNPIAAALQQHLDHSHIWTTAIYGLDPHERLAEEKSSTLLRRQEVDEESFFKLMKEVSHEHFTEKIADLLNGKPVGGMYSRLVLKLASRLSKEADFSISPIKTKSRILSDKMKNRGFASIEHGHGMCMAGTARHTIKKAHCSDEDGTHPEIASPNVCKGCINLLNPEGYQTHLARERDELLQEASDMTLPRALRQAKKKDAADVDAYLEADRRIAKGNKQIILKLVESWSTLEEQSDK